ncbi:MAG: M23 family metallopeptidase [Pseudonocardia sp.]|nr:M23 family metallopeptidase [Pseudonocardia sp.]
MTPAAAGAGVAASRSHGSSRLSSLSEAGPTRLVAVVVAGSALAAAGQMALSQALPAAADGANLLRIGLGELLAPGAPVAQAALPLVAEPLPSVAPVAPEPQVVGAADLVKAAEFQRVLAEEAARAAEEARLAEEARVVEEARLAAETAVASAAGGVQMVVGRITSGFGARWGSSHQGLDIAAPIGTPIRVPLDGTVIDSGPASGFGQWVRVRHDDGTVTVYGHISESHVRVGQSVSAGDVIADVGNEGRSTGPHLHFEVITPGGTKVNPRPWLDERGIGLT